MTRRRLPATAAPERLSDEERLRIRTWVADRFPGMSRRQLADEWERCRDWHLSNGVLRSSWEATFRNWLRKGSMFSVRAGAQNPTAGLPSRAPVRTHSELEPIGQVLEMFRRRG